MAYGSATGLPGMLAAASPGEPRSGDAFRNGERRVLDDAILSIALTTMPLGAIAILAPDSTGVNWTKVDPLVCVHGGVDQRPGLLDRLLQLAERRRVRAIAVQVRDDHQRGSGSSSASSVTMRPDSRQSGQGKVARDTRRCASLPHRGMLDDLRHRRLELRESDRLG